MTELEQQLQQLLDKVERKRYLDKQVEQLIPQRTELRDKCQQLNEIMYKENQDVDLLEKSSVAGFFLDMFGKREEKLEKERREAYAAKMKYDTAKYELDVLERSIDRYTQELCTLENAETELENQLNTYMADAANADNTIVLQTQLSLLKGKKLEMEEAITAGNQVIASTDIILTYLDKADGWSTADLFFDNILMDIAKHDNLDKATAEINNLQACLRKFKSELADVTIDKNISINIDSFLTFADYFWDGIFSNLAVQEKIADATRQVQNVKYKAQDTISTLTLMINDNNRQQQEIEQKLK